MKHSLINTGDIAQYRDRFNWPVNADGARQTYLCGNSLGLQPRRAVERVQEVLSDWSSLAVEGHFDAKRPWLTYHEQAAPLLARLLGCDASECVTMNTLTINLNLLMISFYRPTEQRYKILIEQDAFPSDRYAVQSQLHLHGHDPANGIVEWTRDDDDYSIDSLAALLDEHDDIALLLLPGVQYLTGEWLDLPAIAALARQHDIPLGLDLAHAVGNVPVNLSMIDADFAVFCTYKYLNGGPGAIGGAWVNQRHHASDLPRLHGWWGNDESTRFLMRDTFEPAAGGDVWQQSNPPILGLAPVIASLEMFDAVGMSALRARSLELTGHLANRLERELADAVQIVTPRDPRRRGAQLSLRLRTDATAAKQVFERLQQADIIGDWREPNIIRVAPAPFYNTLEDTDRLVDVLTAALS